MTDVVDQQTRSRMMAGIKGKNTKPEVALRRALHACGFRFRLHSSNVFGRPDLLFPKYRAVVFVHGCFWHRHIGCRYCSTPSTRTEFWQDKFAANITRDNRVRTQLRSDGWRIAVVWECQLRTPVDIDATAEVMARWLQSDQPEIEIGRSATLLTAR